MRTVAAQAVPWRRAGVGAQAVPWRRAGVAAQAVPWRRAGVGAQAAVRKGTVAALAAPSPRVPVAPLVASLLLFAFFSTPLAAAQPPAPPRLEVDLSTPGWFGRTTPLVLDVEVRSRDPVSSLRVTVTLHGIVRSRTELRNVFAGRLPRTTPLHAFTVPLQDLPGGGSQRFRVERSLDQLQGFQDAPSGLYSLSVSVRQSTGPPLRTVATAVAYLAEPPAVPLGIVPVIGIGAPPAGGPSARGGQAARRALAALRRDLAALGRPALPYGVALSPLVAEQLRLLRTGGLRGEAAAVEEALRELAGGGEELTMPLLHADLRHLPDLETSVAAQLDAGREALRRLLGASPVPVLLPPALALDERSAAEAARGGLAGSFVAGSVVARSTTTPAELAIFRGLRLIPADALLPQLLDAPASQLAVSRAVADTAMLYFESPARERVVGLVADLGGRAAALASFLEAIRGLPWIRPLSPSQATRAPAVTLRALGGQRPPRPPRPYLRAAAEARRAVADLAAVTQEGNPRVAALDLAAQAASSTAWWEEDWDAGLSWARRVTAAVRAEQRMVRAATTAPVTFTSRRGQVPVTVVNRAGYPVRVRVEVSSPKLRFPDGNAVVLAPLDPPGQTVTFRATTEATGTFPLKVRLTSLDGAVVVDEEEMVVRSTAYNVLALSLTLGAAGFLCAWYGGRWLAGRRRRAAGPAPESPAA